MERRFEDPSAGPPWEGDPWGGAPEGTWGTPGHEEDIEDDAVVLSAHLERINSRFSELQEGVRAAALATRRAEEARDNARSSLAASKERALGAVAQRWGELGERVEEEHARVQRTLQEEMSRLSLALESLHVSSDPAPRHRAGIPAEPETPPTGSRGSQGPQGSRLHAETLDWSHLDMGPLLEAIATFGPHSQEERGRPVRRGPQGLPVKTPRAPPEGTPRIGPPPRGRPGPAPSHSTPKATASPRGARSLPRSGARDPSPCTLAPKSPRPRAATPAGRARVAGTTPHAGARSDRDDHHQHQQREEEEADEDGLLFQFGSQGRGMGEFMNLQGVAVTPSGRIVTADSGKHAVQVFLSTGEFLTQFGVRGRDPGQMVHPSGVAVRANGDLLVTDPETRSLNVYAPDGRHRSQLGVGLLQAPRGVCTTDSGLALVADNKACAVVALTAAGKVHAKFGGRAADLGRLRGPNYVALNSKGDVIVSDFLDHSVKVFSGGEFLFQFGGFGSAEGQLHGPTGVAVDPADNILVADWGNARIQVFNCVGAFKGVLAPSVHPLSCPQGLALSPEGTRLVVADTGNHCCKVYSYHQH